MRITTGMLAIIGSTGKCTEISAGPTNVPTIRASITDGSIVPIIVPLGARTKISMRTILAHGTITMSGGASDGADLCRRGRVGAEAGARKRSRTGSLVTAR